MIWGRGQRDENLSAEDIQSMLSTFQTVVRLCPPKSGGRGGVHSKNREIEHLGEEEDEESVWLGTAEPSAASPFCVCVCAHSHASVQMHLEVRS